MLRPRPKPSRRDRRTHRGPLEWVGAKVTVPVYVTEGEPYRPEAIVWLELPSDLIVQWTLIDPARPAPSFADTLRDAMRSPDAGPPRRPARVRVADRTLAGEVRAVLAGLAGLAEATEIVIAPTPEIDELVRRFAESAPEGDAQESYLEGGRVPPAAVAALFRAASVLHHSAPWKIANDGQVLRLDVPELGIAGGAISIIGALGVSLGFLVFPSLEAYDAFARAGERHAKDVRRRRPPERLDLGSSVLTLTLDPAADLAASMRKEVLKHGWSVAGLEAYPRVLHVERDGVVRPHGEDEVRLVTACALALAAFVTKHEALFSGRRLEPVSESYTADTTGLTVRLTAPYEAFEIFEDDPEHPDNPRPAATGGRRLGRNEPCPCGSGKKYKRCHLDADEAAAGGTRASSSGGDAPSETSDLHALDRRLAHDLAIYARDRFGAEWLRFERDFSDAQAAVQLAGHWALYHLRVRGRRVVEHFQAERGERLTAEERAWLGAQSRAWLGVWEVEDAEPGVSLDLHDLLTGERRHVIEASGSRTIVRRSAALARIVDHRGLSLICGTHAQPLPPLEAAEVARAFRDRLRRGPASPIERLREERTGRDLIARWDEACAALEERSRVPPRLHNTDGDELVFVTQRFDFDPAARDEIERRLRAMDDVVPPDDGDAERDYVFHREGGGGRPGWGDLIVGHAEVGERALGVETNSMRRAQALRRRIVAALGDLVLYRRSRRRDAQRMAERAWERGPSTHDASARGDVGARDLQADPAVQQALREMKERHYAGWPDEPLPALGGKTARQAVRSGAGRERVDALLKDIEHREAGLPAAERFDVAVLRHALGI